MFWRTYWHPEMENIVTMLNSVALVSWSPCDIDQFFSGVNCVMFGGMTQEIVLKTDGSEVFLVFCASELPSGHYWQSLPYYVHAVLLYFFFQFLLYIPFDCWWYYFPFVSYWYQWHLWRDIFAWAEWFVLILPCSFPVGIMFGLTDSHYCVCL